MSRSNLHGEAQAASAALHALEYVKCFRALMRHPNVDTMDHSTMHLTDQSLTVIRSKSFYDAAKRDGVTSFTDKSTGIEILKLRERLSASLTTLRSV